MFVPYGASAPAAGDVESLTASHVDNMIGSTLDRKYEILERLGSGGMAVVYKAMQTSIGRVVAVKTMQMSLSTDPVLKQRFQREMNSLGKLSHPNIVSVFASGETDIGQLYMVMDYLSGPTLQQVLENEKCLPIERAQHLFLQICDALNHAHKRDVVHRDLKPGNIILEKDEKGNDLVKVVDFGLAKIGESAERLTKAGEIWGSALYMSPEQCSGLDVDHRTDMYSLGVIMYQTLTGRVPFRGKTFMETVGKHVNERPPRMSSVNPDLVLPDMVEHVIMRCLEKNPDDRYPSVADLKSSLLAVLPAHSVTSRERLSTGERPKMSGGFNAPEPKRSQTKMNAPQKPTVSKTHTQLKKPDKATKTSARLGFLIIGVLAFLCLCILGIINLVKGGAPNTVPSTQPAAQVAPGNTATTSSAPSNSTTTQPTQASATKAPPSPPQSRVRNNRSAQRSAVRRTPIRAGSTDWSGSDIPHHRRQKDERDILNGVDKRYPRH